MPAPDQRCCGTCAHVEEVIPADGEHGAALQCRVLLATTEELAGVARWWGSACVKWERRTEVQP
jgi:hypothetical protein